MVEWFCKPKTDSLISEGALTPPVEGPPPDIIPEPSFYLEPDRIAGLGYDTPTPEDELVAVMMSSMAGYMMESYETNDCMKRIDIIKPSPPPQVQEESEDEDVREPSIAKELEEKRASTKNQYTKRKSKMGKSPAQGPKKQMSRASRSTIVDVIDEEERRSVDEIEDVIPELFHEEVESTVEQVVEESFEQEEVEEDAPLASRLRRIRECAEEIDRKFHSWKFRELDQMVDVDFIHNSRYEGRMSRMLMEEHGKFTWNNGQTYKGTFHRGYCTGNGIIEWNANSIYEGQVYCNLRNGFGVKTYVNGPKKMYHAGQWRNGKKHGKGISVYDDGNWYDGEWENGQRTGIGTRCYKDGGRYHGQWYKGLRHGKGTMVWPNNDVYIGEWNFGQMHGKGKYIWKSFRNETIVTPLVNSYDGEWDQNRRHGKGLLELMNGGILKTNWYDGKKSGSAEIICRNGKTLRFVDFFENDRIALRRSRTSSTVARDDLAHRRKSVTNDQNFVKIRFHNDEEADKLDLSQTSLQIVNDNLNNYETPQVPINAPVHTKDFSLHIEKLFEIKSTSLLPLGENDPKPPSIPEWEKKAILWLENKWLQKVVIARMEILTKVYNFYSLILNDLNVPEFKFCMPRLALWLLLKHCGLKETGLTTVKIDEMMNSTHEPFDKIMMHTLIDYLLLMSWLLFVPKRIKNQDIPGIIAACFDKFLTEVVADAPRKYDGIFHKFLSFVPFEALNSLYKTFDYPLRIEDLCARLYVLTDKEFEDQLSFLPPYYKYILQGKNIIGADGFLSYIPYEEPIIDLTKMRLPREEIKPSELRVLGRIGIDNVVRCINEAVPEAINPENDELECEYELSFNEFCDILVNLVTVYLDLSEEFYKKLVEESAKAAINVNEESGKGDGGMQRTDEGGKRNIIPTPSELNNDAPPKPVMKKRASKMKK